MKFERKRIKAKDINHSECEDEESKCIPLHLEEMVDTFLSNTRRILLVGEIDEVCSAHICSYLQLFALKKEPIYIYINSPGGCLSCGYAIVDQMKACPCPIYTIIRGKAHSMAGIIAAFGTKGHRYATPNSSIMLHSVIVDSPPEPIGLYTTMIEHVKEDYENKIEDMAKVLSITLKQLKTLMAETRWMIPEKAIQIGLIDGIWTPSLERSIDKSVKK